MLPAAQYKALKERTVPPCYHAKRECTRSVWDFGNHRGEIRGTIWNDLDGDGLRDAGESALSDRRVYLDMNRSGTMDAGDESTWTDGEGNFELRDGNIGL